MNMSEVIRFRPAFPSVLGAGFSAESRRAEETMLAIADEDAATIYKSERGVRIASAVAELRDDYSENGWDGYDAKAVTPETLAQAEAFLSSLPFALPLPDVFPETTGAIAFEWGGGASATFVVSIADSGRLVFAGRFGRAKSNGVDYFADGIPSGILSAIRRVLS